MQRVAPLIGIPYRMHGQTPGPEGWDCQACARFVRTTIFERPWYADGITYSFEEARDPKLRAAKIAEQLGRWQHLGRDPGDIRPGAVLLFRYFNAISHVAVALTRTEFIHVVADHETSIVDFDREPAWAHRLRGIYD
jgi:hypothetical protein